YHHVPLRYLPAEHLNYFSPVVRFVIPLWARNVRVGENSPSLCPTMFSVTYTGTNLLPLCTAIVCPTISGRIVERRDHVRIARLSALFSIARIFSSRCPSTNGPFLTERPIAPCSCVFASSRYLLRRRTINLLVRLLRRVLYPFVGTPHGVTGWRPPDVLPSPPPWGWSTGFMETPRLWGLRPSQRVRPAFPPETFLWSMLPIWPTVARQSTATMRTSPEGSLTCA